VPWWAHWKTIDTIAAIALGPVSLLFFGIAAYVWRLVRQLRRGQRHFIGAELAGSPMPAWQTMLYVAPLVLMVLIFIASYLVVNTLYGYNPYEVLIMFHIAAPPGVYISGILILIIVPLWGLLLAGVGLFTRPRKYVI
jgi:hypothetical protein